MIPLLMVSMRLQKWGFCNNEIQTSSTIVQMLYVHVYVVECDFTHTDQDYFADTGATLLCSLMPVKTKEIQENMAQDLLSVDWLYHHNEARHTTNVYIFRMILCMSVSCADGGISNLL